MNTGSKILLSLMATVGLSVSGSALAEKLNGTVKIDGSSTVYPLSEAVAEEFLQVQPNVRVTVGVSGTGGGFKKFAVGEIDMSDASRPIREEEQKKAAEHKVEFIELPVAYDGIAVVVNKANAVKNITNEELRTIWGTSVKPTHWNEVNKSWPKEAIKLYGPGPDSGTFDYFAEAVLEKGGKPRPDYTQSEDDNVLVRGIAGDKNSLGYFGYSYYLENKDKVAALQVNGVSPTGETIESGEYFLSRPVFIYVSKKSLERPEVKEFVEYYLDNAHKLATDVGMVPLSDKLYAAAKKRLKDQTTGTVFGKGKGSLSQLYNVN